MPLDTTVGGADANSYASVDEFKVYRTSRFPAVAAVVAANDASIEAALIVGCRIIDQDFDWTGSAVDAVQQLTWPRAGMLTRNGFAVATTAIPRELKTAQCEVAYELLTGVDLLADNDAVKAGLSSLKAGSVALSWQSVNTSTSESVDMIIRRLGSEFNYVSDQIKGEVRRLLVPSWFAQPSIMRPVLFVGFGGTKAGC